MTNSETGATPFATPQSLTEWRQRFGYSQRQAAAAIGCSRGSWAGYEHGEQPIPKYISLAIAALSARGRLMTFDEIETGAVAAIRSADHFTASIFLGRGHYRIEKCPTVLAAMQAAREIESDPAAFTRRALIYAIASDGHATLLTAALIEKLLSVKSKG
ncbi:helix-turn-helix domain-containing protein [Bradyrhizobium japonicum]|uniref:helix-turn-helix domain-containing protein n=1 Tax=Bradyrhizobium japonicum TaxID=375 RepID=UPI00209CD557|nr:helix-turn-helix transcriptional regulator [Bradyrhizobium japonicum]MCP1761960.1 transcriptional regulator with XRE-family HTH domain [Bradyrhizobium japonicum]MCP1793540.1 transcriptional regulator with XRE-family HTH domain [Bradyrhizobium japonicum]MCP1805973.1 transcriptional regulator with XRE-family HTH domain [Bradyrhizobium japonicum]MCP1812376.1 transcriptional regulator with XRE-family HTH domain [Bradyrhizobium japonicum]MCP1873581.1 transcriptional regulator with XRE-family HTH